MTDVSGERFGVPQQIGKQLDKLTVPFINKIDRVGAQSQTLVHHDEALLAAYVNVQLGSLPLVLHRTIEATVLDVLKQGINPLNRKEYLFNVGR